MSNSSSGWYAGVRSTAVTHALGQALKMRVEDPYRLLAIAVVGQAFIDHVPVDQGWVDLADIDAERLGVLVMTS